MHNSVVHSSIRLRLSAHLAGGTILLTASAVLAQNAPQPPAAPGQSFIQQSPQRGETVTSRRRPQYDAVGIRAGSFFIYPSASLTGLVDTNVFQSPNANADVVLIFSPEVVARSNWTRHELNFGARADIGRFNRFNTENYEDASFTANGRYDIQREGFLFGGARAAQRHEERSSADEAGGISPTKFWAFEGTGGWQQRFNRITTRIEGLYRGLDFYDVLALGPGGFVEVNNDDRDRNGGSPAA